MGRPSWRALVALAVLAIALGGLLVKEMRAGRMLVQRVEALESAARSGAREAPPVEGEPISHRPLPASMAAPPDFEPGLDRMPTFAEEARATGDLQAQLESRFRAEARDTVWAARAEGELRSAASDGSIAASGMKPQYYDADCRSRTCRITLAFDRAADAEEWGVMYVTVAGGTMSQTQMVMTRRPDDGADLTIYGMRR